MNTIIEKIRAEVNRQRTFYNLNNPYNKRAIRVCNNILSALGNLEKEEKPTLQEQPVDTSEDERINTAIFKALSKKDARDVLKECGVDVGDALDYLKRQSKEQPVEVHPLFRVGDYVRNKTTKDKVLIEQLDMEKKIYFYFTWDGAAEVHSDFSFSKQEEWELIGQTVGDKQLVCEGLEDEIGHWLDKLDDKYCMLMESFSIGDVKETARHFYELGRQSECVKVKAEPSIDKFILENCTHCTIEHCPGMRKCYTSSNKQLQ